MSLVIRNVNSEHYKDLDKRLLAESLREYEETLRDQYPNSTFSSNDFSIRYSRKRDAVGIFVECQGTKRLANPLEMDDKGILLAVNLFDKVYQQILIARSIEDMLRSSHLLAG